MVEQKVILLYIKNYNQNSDEDSNNLSTTSINNCKSATCQSNVIRTTGTPDSNGIKNDGLAALTREKKFTINTTPFKLDSTETEFNKRKNSSPLICELDTPVSNELMSKPSGVDFDVVIDKPSKQESPQFKH